MRLIDPPVNVMSPLANIREWVIELERELHRASEEDRPDLERALEQARGWIRLREEIGPVRNAE